MDSMDDSTKSGNLWNTTLYRLQMTAPKPQALLRNSEILIEKCPAFYSSEYWGNLGHKQTKKLLDKQPDGAYLLRKSPSADDGYALSIQYDNRIRHFKVYYDPFRQHYLQGADHLRTYKSLDDMVQDGLISFHISKFGQSIMQKILTQEGVSYEGSPYMTINKSKLMQLARSKSELVAAEATTETPKAEKKIGPEAVESQEQPHKFKSYNFKGLNWCELCANFLWGFTAQGVKCENCGFQAHHKCSQSVPASCVPDLKKIRGIFGADLTTMVTLHNDGIPFVVRKCVKEIEGRGLHQEGIYRVSGFADEIETLKLQLDKNGDATDMSEKAYNNINVIAGILKLYLRLLPVPLITLSLHLPLLDASSKTDFLNPKDRYNSA